ncbi:hypothetical protein [Beggiatoa leptomitoformis]|uniref:Uncharacterized protein n=1 Tax=Beggiatoa leptomitoformis TaxID=288004 RepID=A0A2N9YBI4_9GAMM|nr:hypothetical protein [Beggiatoa leptomitoformis]ALG69295.2 hypothetical protein AL038_02710 [Beggiatoa leptomitoformis]AUI67826.1 hypothetical protein BLE401_03340 [Beggiatoa leptomitoformis]
MKKLWYSIGLAGLFFSINVIANSPTDINFAAKKKTTFGTEYVVYNVRCSDGTTRQISSWNNRKEWCVGTSNNDCSNSQLKAAQMACESK